MKLKLMMMLVIMMIVPVLAHAEDANAHRPYEANWNLLSYSRQGSLNLYGGDLSLTGYPWKNIGITSDLAIHSANVGTSTVTTNTYRFGPKFIVKRGSRVTTFGEVLVGGTHVTGSVATINGGTTTTTSASANGFALAFGGGVDIAIRPWIGVRIAQFDYSYIRPDGVNSEGLRVGGGLVFRFGPHK